MKLAFIGDIMPGGVLPYQKEYVTDEVRKLLRSFDCRIGTLECAMGDNLPYDTTKMNGRMNIIYSPTKEIERLLELGIDVVSLANNHVYDLGEEGLKSTMELLDKYGIKHCGAGRNLEEASQPAVVSINGKSIAFLSYCHYGNIYLGYVELATEHHAGVCPLDIDRCVKDIKRAKQQYDYVFVLPHWGIEYQYLPTPECVEFAKQMIKAGADGVFASHTHQIQPLIKYKSKPIAFSMGNFLFPDYYMAPPRPIWYPESIEGLQTLPRFPFYPNRVETPCVQVWRHLSRIGMLVVCNISDVVKTSYQLVYCSEQNTLTVYSRPAFMKMRMSWMGGIVGLKPYSLLYTAYNSRYNIIRRGFHKIRRMIKI